jgi:hypothetical protein
MEAETFTFEITPEKCGSPNACFQLTVDVGDCAPTFSNWSSSPGGSGGGLSWQQPWYQASANNTGYYYPYYYNCYGCSQRGSPDQNKSLQATGTASSISLPTAPKLAPAATSQSSTASTNHELKSKHPLKRVPTPHPRRPSAAALPKPAINATTSARRNDTKSRESSNDAGIKNLQKLVKPLSERLNRHSLSSKCLSGDEGKNKFEIVGRPLWSGNFSGANCPAQTSVPCKPKANINHSTALKGNAILSGGSMNNSSPEKVHAEGNTAPAPTFSRKSMKEQPPVGVPQQSTTSPVLQYVSYNYRPLVVQSPTCGNGSGVFLPTAFSSSSARFRTTSTLETICLSTD